MFVKFVFYKYVKRTITTTIYTTITTITTDYIRPQECLESKNA